MARSARHKSSAVQLWWNPDCCGYVWYHVTGKISQWYGDHGDPFGEALLLMHRAKKKLCKLVIPLTREISANQWRAILKGFETENQSIYIVGSP